MRKKLALAISGLVLFWALGCAPSEDIDALKGKVEKLEREIASLKQKVNNHETSINLIRDALKAKKIEVKLPEPVKEEKSQAEEKTQKEPEKTKTKKKLK